MINTNNIVALIVVISICAIIYKLYLEDNEHLTSVSSGILSNEAIQTMGSVLNSGNGTINNLTFTGTIKIGSTTINPDGSMKIGNTTIDKDGNIFNAKLNWQTGKSNWYLGPEGTDGFVVRNNVQGKDYRIFVGPDVYADIGNGMYTPGNITVGNDLILDGSNKWIFHTPNDGRKTLFVAPSNNSNGWDFDQSTKFIKASRVQPGKKARNGNDVVGDLFAVDNAACINECGRIPGITRALYNAKDRKCWCKNNDINSYEKDDSNYITSDSF